MSFDNASSCEKGFDGVLCGGCASDYMLTGAFKCDGCDSFNPAVKAMQIVASILLICIMCTFEVLHASMLIKEQTAAAVNPKIANARWTP